MGTRLPLSKTKGSPIFSAGTGKAGTPCVDGWGSHPSLTFPACKPVDQDRVAMTYPWLNGAIATYGAATLFARLVLINLP